MKARLANKAVSALGLIAAAAVFGVASASVVRVPADAPTVQAALNLITAGDTVSIAPGRYVEALLAPPFGFSMIGELLLDSSAQSRTIIDPTELENSDTLACLTLTGGDTVQIRDVEFRNGLDMLLHRQTPFWGGIKGCSEIDALSLLRCEFDSTFMGITSCHNVTLDSCCFRACTYGCAFAAQPDGKMTARHSYFESVFSSILTARTGSSFEKCRFVQRAPHDGLWLIGDSIRVTECSFGPSFAEFGSMVNVRPRLGTVLRDNVFADCRNAQGALNIVEVCSLQSGISFEGAIVERNRFVRCAGGAIHVNCSDGSYGHVGEPAYITCADICSSQVTGGAFSAGIFCQATCRIDSCVFRELDPPHVRVIMTASLAEGDSVFIRNCVFEAEQFGVYVEPQFQTHADARWNWWGDSSGPFHFALNPEGRGAEVSNGVEFAPWLTDSSMQTPGLRGTLPNEMQLFAFPNPFNPTTTLSFSLPNTSEVKIVVHDILGREVLREHLSRLDAGRHDYRLDGSKWSSGLYFASLHANNSHHITKVALVK